MQKYLGAAPEAAQYLQHKYAGVLLINVEED